MKNRMQKSVSESITENTYVVLPENTNPLGNLFGGAMMSWIDITASIAAMRHCDNVVVTAAIDDLHFIHPIKLGDVVTMKAAVNFASQHSVEVGVKVFSECPTKKKKKHTASAYLTFVSLNKKGELQTVPKINSQTKEETRRYNEAQKRRRERLKRRKKTN